jgi:hypothetical protein
MHTKWKLLNKIPPFFITLILLSAGLSMALISADLPEAGVKYESGNFNNSYGSFKETINFAFEYDHKQIELNYEEWDYIKFEDGDSMLVPGQAMVPYKLHSMITRDEIVDVSIELRNPEVLYGIKLAPAPTPKPMHNEGSNPINVNDIEIDTDYYAQDKFFPGEHLKWLKLGGRQVDGEQLWYYSIVIYPAQYNPKSNTLKTYQDSSITITYENSGSLIEVEQHNAQTSSDTSTGTSSRGVRATEPSEIKYLIFTYSSLMDEMQVLADWKTQKGIPAEVFDVNDVFNNNSVKGDDDEETLRNFIREMYKKYQTEYVLLAGDYDKVPPRMTIDPDPIDPYDDGWIPMDLYYACIDEGSTWDKDGDGKYGEQGDLDDIIPDLAIGRLAINDGTKMALKIQEIIDYEVSPPPGDWTGNAILVGSDVHEYDDGQKQCDYLEDKYLDTVYSQSTKLYDPDNSLDTSSFKEAVNSGSSLIVYLGHGSSHVWTHEKGGTSILFENPNVATLTNGNMMPVITTVSCDTSWFDAPKNNPYLDCIGEAFTEIPGKGAIGYLGSTRTTVGWLSQSYAPYAPGLQEDFVRQINLDNLHLGWTYVEGMTHYAQSWGHRFANSGSGEEQGCWQEYHLLGEPEVPLWVDTPKEFKITKNTAGSSIIITVKDADDKPVEGARVCVWLKDVAYDYVITGSDGTAEFDLISTSDEEATLTVTKQRFLPHISKVKLLDVVPPITSYEMTPAEPDGNNNWYTAPPEIQFNTNEKSAKTYFKWDNSPGFDEYDEPIYAPEGKHTLHFYSIDAANNIELEKQAIIKVDTIGPETDINCTPTEPDGENGWYVTVPDIKLIQETSTTLYYHWDSFPNTIYEKPLKGLVGTHTLYYHARDEAGHVEPTKSMDIKIDLDTPSTSIIMDPPLPNGNHNWYISKPTVSFDVSETHQFETYYYWDDNSDVPELFSEPFTADKEGAHTLHYYSVDVAGNLEESKWLDIKVDTVDPKTSIEVTPSQPTGIDQWYKGESPIVTLTSTEPAANIYYYWDTENMRAVYSDPLEPPEGDHTLFYYSVDPAGNRDDMHKARLRVDTVAPVASYDIISDEQVSGNNWYYEMPNIDLFNDEEGVMYYYMLEGDQSIDDLAEEQLDSLKQTYVAIYPLEGIYSYYFYAVDEAGNIGEMEQLKIRMDLYDPEAKLRASTDIVMEDRWVLFNASGSTDNNPITKYQFYIGDNYESGWQASPVLNHTFSKPGTYEVIVKVKDKSGRISERSEPIKITVTEDPNKGGNIILEKLSTSPIILALVIIIVVVIIAAILFVRHKKSKIDWEDDQSADEDDFEDSDILPPPPPPKGGRFAKSYSASTAVSGRKRKRLRHTPPPPPPLPPPPPSVVRIVHGKGSNDIDDDIDWEDEEDEIEWEDNSSKKVQLECPRCDKRFKTPASSMKSGKAHKVTCPHCGARGAL